MLEALKGFENDAISGAFDIRLEGGFVSVGLRAYHLDAREEYNSPVRNPSILEARTGYKIAQWGIEMRKQYLLRRVNSQKKNATTCTPSDTGTSYQLLHRLNWQHLAIVLFLLLAMGGTLGTGTAHAQTRAYESNSADNTVSVIDTATNAVVATIPVGGFPLGVAITPDGTRAYVTNQESNTISVIDTATNTVVATIPVGGGPNGVAITPDGTGAYVTDLFSDSVSVIDTATNTVVATIPVGGSPDQIAITPDGTRTYVTNVNSNTVSVTDTATNTVVATIPVGGGPVGVAITPDGTRAYLTNVYVYPNTVSVVDTATNTVVTTISCWLRSPRLGSHHAGWNRSLRDQSGL